MPFASKFRAMMGLPFAGEAIGGFVVERIEVRDVPTPGRYVYSVDMVLRGPGGEQGVRRALKELLGAHPLTFSAYGNPYQLFCGRPEVERLGDGRYAVRAEGSGVRVHVAEELERFLGYLGERGLLAEGTDAVDGEALVAAYLDGHRAQVKRRVDRYRGRLRRDEAAAEAQGEDGG